MVSSFWRGVVEQHDYMTVSIELRVVSWVSIGSIYGTHNKSRCRLYTASKRNIILPNQSTYDLSPATKIINTRHGTYVAGGGVKIKNTSKSDNIRIQIQLSSPAVNNNYSLTTFNDFNVVVDIRLVRSFAK